MAYPNDVTPIPLVSELAPVRAEPAFWNRIATEVDAIKGTLGVNPQGSAATVKARLDALPSGGSTGGSSAFPPLRYSIPTAQLVNVAGNVYTRVWKTPNIDWTGVQGVKVSFQAMFNSSFTLGSYWTVEVGDTLNTPTGLPSFWCWGTGIQIVNRWNVLAGPFSGSKPLSLWVNGVLSWTKEQWYDIHEVLIERY